MNKRKCLICDKPDSIPCYTDKDKKQFFICEKHEKAWSNSKEFEEFLNYHGKIEWIKYFSKWLERQKIREVVQFT